VKTLIYSLLLAALISLPVACEGGLDSYGDFNCSGNAKFQGNVNIKDEYNLPAEDGTNGQVIKTDGGGNAVFAEETIPSFQQVTDVSAGTTQSIGVGGVSITQSGEFGDASLIFYTADKSGYLYLAGGDGEFHSASKMSIGSRFGLFDQGWGEDCVLAMSNTGGTGHLTYPKDVDRFVFDKQTEVTDLIVRPLSGETATVGLYHQAGVVYLDAKDDALTIRNDGQEMLTIGGAGTLYIHGQNTVGGYYLPNADGAAGQVMKTDGAGAVTWEDDVSGGDFEWTVGSGEADVDYAITFNGEDSDGTITWLEDEEQFQLACDLAVTDSVFVARDFAVGGVAPAQSALYVKGGIVNTLSTNSVWMPSVSVDLPAGLSFQYGDQETRTLEFFARTPVQNLPVPLNGGFEFVKIGARPNGTNDNWALWTDDQGKLKYSAVVEGESVVITSTVNHNVLDGSWHHILAKIESGEIGLYLDGEQVAYGSSGFQSAGEDNSIELCGNGAGYALEISHLRLENDNPYGLIPNVGCTDTFVVPTTPPAVTGNTQFYLRLTDDLVSEGIESGYVLEDRVENTSMFTNRGYFDAGSLLIGISQPVVNLNSDTDITGDVVLGGRLIDSSDNYLTLAAKTISISISKPLDLAEADNLPIWTNRSGKPFVVDKIYATSNLDDVDFTLVETNDYTDLTDITTIEAVTIDQDGTDVFYKEILAVDIDHTGIEDGHGIVFNNDGTDDPDYIDITIVGYFKDI